MGLVFLVRHGLTAQTGRAAVRAHAGDRPGPARRRPGGRAASSGSTASACRRSTRSPLERCRQTVEPLASARRLTRPHRRRLPRDGRRAAGPDARSRRCAGRRRGGPSSRRRARSRSRGGEAFVDAQARVVDAIDRLARRHRRGAIVIATHGDIARIALAHYQATPLDEFQRIVIDTAAVSALLLGGRPPARPARERHGRARAVPRRAHRALGGPRDARSRGRCEDSPHGPGRGRPHHRRRDRRAGDAHVLPAGARRRAARHGDRREGAGRAARALGARARHRGPGPRRRRARGRCALEEPVDPRWRAGQALDRVRRRAGPLPARDRRVRPRGRRRGRRTVGPAARSRSRSRCGPAASRCSRSPATAPRWSRAAGRAASSAATRWTRRGTCVRPRTGIERRGPDGPRRRWPPARSRCSARSPSPPTPPCWCAA